MRGAASLRVRFMYLGPCCEVSKVVHDLPVLHIRPFLVCVEARHTLEYEEYFGFNYSRYLRDSTNLATMEMSGDSLSCRSRHLCVAFIVCSCFPETE